MRTESELDNVTSKGKEKTHIKYDQKPEAQGRGFRERRKSTR